MSRTSAALLRLLQPRRRRQAARMPRCRRQWRMMTSTIRRMRTGAGLNPEDLEKFLVLDRRRRAVVGSVRYVLCVLE